MVSLQLPSSTAVIDALSLSPNPHGGWFRHLPEEVAASGIGPRVVNYLLAVDSPITYFHRLSVDSVYYFHQGCPLVVLTISRDGALGRTVLGGDLDEGHHLQCPVPATWWRAFELAGEPWALMSSAASTSSPAHEENATTALLEHEVPRLPIDVERFVKAWASVTPTPLFVDLQARLGLESNMEGGFFRQTYESADEVETAEGVRPAMNSIFYLLTAQSPIGALHRNRSVIAHFHHAGVPATYLLVTPDGEVTEVVLGRDYVAGQVPAFAAPGDCWKTSRIERLDGAGGCLISEAVVPGFRYDDHEMATLAGFAREHPTLVDRFRPYIADAET